MSMRLLSLILYYLIGARLPSKLLNRVGILIRRQLVKKIFFHVGENVNIGRNVYFGRGGKISIGYNSGLGEHSYIIAVDEVEIGDNVMVAPFVKIFTGGHDYVDPEELLVHQNVVLGRVIIGSDVWIGAASILLPNVDIESRVIISAGSVLPAGVYESGWIYGGNPAKKIKRIPCKEIVHE